MVHDYHLRAIVSVKGYSHIGRRGNGLWYPLQYSAIVLLDGYCLLLFVQPLVVEDF